MLAKQLVLNALLKRQTPTIVQRATHATGGFHDERLPIGKREWVGYCINPQPNYIDRPDYPMPAVRFMEITGDIAALKEKEKGDWKKLSLEDKKKLYRASFRQTLVEVDAPTGQWKSIFGWALFFTAIGLWVYIFEKQFVYKPLPHTFSEEWRAHTMRRMIDNKDRHLSGLSAQWDYEKDDWKQ